MIAANAVRIVITQIRRNSRQPDVTAKTLFAVRASIVCAGVRSISRQRWQARTRTSLNQRDICTVNRGIRGDIVTESRSVDGLSGSHFGLGDIGRIDLSIARYIPGEEAHAKRDIVRVR